MSADRGIVAEGERGHRRGIVLGFTMAELMLLLLFCLLLVSAGIVAQKDAEIAALEQAGQAGVTVKDIAGLKASNLELQKLLLLLFPAGVPKLSPPQVDALWHELVLARDDRAALQQAGLDATPEQMAALAEISRQLQAQSGLDAETLKRLIEQLQRLSAAGLAELSPEEFSRLIALAKGADQPSGHKWPPIISIADDGNRFEIGSAELKPAFRHSLDAEVSQRVLEQLATYDADVVEIIGHTDEQPITPTRPSNLDVNAIPVVQGEMPSDALVAVDNTGLGMARAIAVASALRATGKFADYKIVPLSAGQLLRPGDILSDGSAAGDDRGRRRIDIRVRRSDAGTSPAN